MVLEKVWWNKFHQTFLIRKNHKKSDVGVVKVSILFAGKKINKQRFECKNCGLLFTDNRPEQRLKNRFVWHKKKGHWTANLKTLIRDSGYSKDILKQTFYAILEQALKIKIIKSEHVNLRMDTTYFEKFCLICYQNNFDCYTQYFSLIKNEFTLAKKQTGKLKKGSPNLN